MGDRKIIPTLPLASAKEAAGGVVDALSPRKGANRATPKKDKKAGRKHARKHSVLEEEGMDDGYVRPRQTELEIATFLEAYLNPIFQCMDIGHMSIQWDEHVQQPQGRNAFSQLLKEKKALLATQPLMSETALNALRIFQNQFSECLQHQEYLRRVVLAQAAVRGFLVRQRLNFSQEISADIRRRNSVFLALLTTERDYIAKLQRISTHFLAPLRTRSLSQEEMIKVVDVFANIEQITANHNEMCSELERIHDAWPLITGVGRLFLMHAKKFEAYGKYAENYFTSMNTLDSISSDKKSWIYTTLEGVFGGISELSELLVLPLRRVEKYEVQLESMIMNSLDAVQDNEEITRAQSIMKNISKLVSAKLEQAETTFQLLQIQRMIVNESPVTIVSDSRRLLKQGTVQLMMSKQKTAMLFLFNDMIVMGKKSQGHERVKYLGQVNLLELEWTQNKEKGCLDLVFKEQTFSIADKDEVWLKAIEEGVKTLKKEGSVMGIEIADLLAREGRGTGIPILVEAIVTWLEQNALDVEGLLRLPGNMEKTNRLMKRLDTASYKDPGEIDLNGEDPHDVARVFRIFFRDMPEPVIPFELYDPLVEIQRDETLEMAVRVQRIAEVLKRVPVSNLPLLKYLIQFLRRVEMNSSVNKMTVSNIAIVFGPNLIRPKVETVQNALEMPLLHGIVQILIEQFDMVLEASGTELQNSGSSRFAPSGRPLSMIFVGKDLKPVAQAPRSRVKGGRQNGASIDPTAATPRVFTSANSLSSSMPVSRSCVTDLAPPGEGGELTRQHSGGTLVSPRPVSNRYIGAVAGQRRQSSAEDASGAAGKEVKHKVQATIAANLPVMKTSQRLLELSKSYSFEQITTAMVESCRDEETFQRVYALVGREMCLKNSAVTNGFVNYFAGITNLWDWSDMDLSNIAKLFAELIGCDAMPWTVMQHIQLDPQSLPQWKVTLYKVFFSHLANLLGASPLQVRLRDATMVKYYTGFLPLEDLPTQQLARDFFSSIGLLAVVDQNSIISPSFHEEDAAPGSPNRSRSKVAFFEERIAEERRKSQRTRGLSPKPQRAKQVVRTNGGGRGKQPQ